MKCFSHVLVWVILIHFVNILSVSELKDRYENYIYIGRDGEKAMPSGFVSSIQKTYNIARDMKWKWREMNKCSENPFWPSVARNSVNILHSNVQDFVRNDWSVRARIAL